MSTQEASPKQNVTVTVTNSGKSVGVSILLTFLFGPLGMFYSTVIGAIVMFIVSVIVAIFTLGMGLVITWPICVIWAAVAANNSKKEVKTVVG